MPGDTFPDLHPMTTDIVPITPTERAARVEKARRLMREAGLDALFLEAGSSLFYYTGVRWSRGQRVMAAILPRRGEIAYVCPGFEEARLREMLPPGAKVRTWEEHESPYQRLAEVLRDRGLSGGRVGFEESVRFYLFDGLRQAVPQLDFASADAVTIPCRAIKSAAEVALMQRAMDITAAALKASLPLLREGMSQDDFLNLCAEAYRACGVQGHASVQYGATTAFPHGSKEMTYLHEGDVVLVDTSCTVEGYYSDLTRTIVYGTPTPRQRAIWELEHEAQAAAFAAAQLGVPMEDVDAAARGVIVRAGLGPGYRVPGLPHRAGHGIGLDIHEWYHIVPGNKRPLAPGMCFSDEPMIAIYGEFGVRLEDCITMTENGPRFFTPPSPSIEQPFA